MKSTRRAAEEKQVTCSRQNRLEEEKQRISKRKEFGLLDILLN